MNWIYRAVCISVHTQPDMGNKYTFIPKDIKEIKTIVHTHTLYAS